MKNLAKAVLSAALALLLALSATQLPFSALKAEVSPAWNVPSGYNENDYNKIAAFLEIADVSGVKNGSKLSSSYDPSYPATWGVCYDPDYYSEMPTFSWEQFNGEYRVRRILVYDKQLVGELDLSDFSELYYANVSTNSIESINLSGCTSLWTFDCYNNRLEDIDISVCPMLHFFRCDGNLLMDLDVSANDGLVQLTCSGNMLVDLDVSNNTSLEMLDVSDNLLNGIDVSMLSMLDSLNVSDNDLYDGLDVSNNPRLQSLRINRTSLEHIDVSNNPDLLGLYSVGNPTTTYDLEANEILMLNTLKSEPGGSVGCELSGWYTKVYAQPNDGYTFAGWYNAENELISMKPEYEASELDGVVFIARFEGGASLPGDADGNGSVTIADAILTLRFSMGLIDENALDTAAADMDGNGSVTIADAISILRMGMGL